jgi:hypothetical protein
VITALQVEACVAIYNQYLELILMTMYEAVDSFEKKLNLSIDIFIAILGRFFDPELQYTY